MSQQQASYGPVAPTPAPVQAYTRHANMVDVDHLLARLDCLRDLQSEHGIHAGAMGVQSAIDMIKRDLEQTHAARVRGVMQRAG